MKTIKLVLAILFSIAVASCGGGGGGAALPPAASTISGTAATGAAIANATIRIKGANGVMVETTTDANGQYTSPDISSLTAPYLVHVSKTSPAVDLYSVGNAAGTVNIHPLTDLIIRTWYDVQSISIDTAFANPAAAPPPSATELGVIASVIEKLVQKWLVAANLNTVTFDLFTTPFPANSSGFDGFLDTLTVASGVIRVDLVSTSGVDQTTTLVVSASGIAASTTIVASGVTSTSFTSAYVPTTAAESAALTGVLATLSNMATTINTRGLALGGPDLLPYFATTYLSRGFNRSQETDSFASDMAGVTLNSFTIDHVLSFNSASSVISISGKASQTIGGVTVVQLVDEEGDGLFFQRQTDGRWLFYGNQKRARAQVSYITERRMLGTTCPTGCDGLYYALQVQVGAVSGVVSSATIAGPISGVVQTLPLTKQGTTYLQNGVLTEHFDLSDASGWFYPTSPANFAPAGTPYTFTVNFVGGGTEIYTRVLGASTSESFALQAGVESTVLHSALAKLGNPVTLSWNLPVSFPIKEVFMHGFVRGGTTGVGCDIQGPMLAATATTGTITLPTTCSSEPVLSGIGVYGYPSINVVVEGVNGEKTDIWYAFQ